MLKPVLLVDDNSNDRELALFALRHSGLKNPVDLAFDGEEALDYLVCRGRYADRPRINPAVILLDIKMPKVNGIEVLQSLRWTPRLRDVPVIVLTTSREEQYYVQSAQLGAHAFVLKPLDVKAFSIAVAQLGLNLAASSNLTGSEVFFRQPWLGAHPVPQ